MLKKPLLSFVGVLLGMLMLSSTVAAQETRLEGALTAAGGGLQSGKAKYEQRNDRTRLSVEVEDLALIGTFTVKVNGTVVGTILVLLGAGDLNLDTRDGDSAPTLSAGAKVEVFASNGALVLSGTIN